MTVLDAYMTDAQTRKFVWGSFDCFLFAAGAVQAKTGVDHMADLRGYADEQSAAILLQERFGTLKLRDVFLRTARKAGAKEVGRIGAQDGDVCCVEWPRLARKPHEIDQSIGLGVFWRWQVFACSKRGVIRVPANQRVIDYWRF